ncbi:MAG: M23 family metallopeptidase [Flammeovirgaceae bacterium]
MKCLAESRFLCCRTAENGISTELKVKIHEQFIQKQDNLTYLRLTISFLLRSQAKTRLISAACCCIFISACSLPEEKFSPFPLDPNFSETSTEISITIKNPLVCPIRINYAYQSTAIHYEHRLDSAETWVIQLPKEKFDLKDVINNSQFSTTFEARADAIIDSTYRYFYPFPKGKTYRVLQGYNGEESHDNNRYRYAVDLDLAEGDTICAAREGIVVGVIEGYELGGNWERYNDYANQIVIDHLDGTFGEYLHLKKGGSLVEVGDEVMGGQAIGLAGNTGYAAVPHLHFNVLVPSEKGYKSLPIKFIHIDGKAIKKGFTLSH